ncbi:MAG: hypothetical protein HFJ40_00220 [Clostridia bacterium]|nr:hypothetical protein [Clostridia bacterium]
MEDNIVIENIEFSEELYQKNISENIFEEEYEGGDIDADNKCNNATE